MNVTGQATIFKNDKGAYKLAVLSKKNQDNGTEKNIFMNMFVGFKKGVEIKNKTKIDIKNGFLTFFQIDTGEFDEKGNKISKKIPKIMILDFDVIEEGIDEVQHSRDYSNKQNNYIENEFGGYSNSSDDLPF